MRADWQYRTSFALFALAQTVVARLDFLVIAVLFGQVPELDGWTLPEVAFPSTVWRTWGSASPTCSSVRWSRSPR